MNFSKWDIKWSPTADDLLLTFNSNVPPDLNLYKVGQLDDDEFELNQAENQVKTQNISLNLSAWAIGTFAELNLPSKADIKCYTWQPKAIPGINLIGVGTSTGKIILTTFDQEHTQDITGLVGQEFCPKHGRPCNLLEWNMQETQLLLAGYDKYRGDSSIAVWDITCQGADSGRGRHLGISDNTVGKPYAEFGSSGELVHSMKWLNNQPYCFVAGIGSKHMRVYDIRDTSKAQSQVTTKSLHGLSVDECTDYRISSFIECKTHIWDLRKLDSYIHCIVEPRPFMKVAWCPTRYNRLACLTKDSSVIKVYSMEHLYKEDMEHSERILQPNGGHQVASFAWHPTDENRIMSITPSGKLTDTMVVDIMPLTWSPHSNLVIGSGHSLQYISYESTDDISSKMKVRALKGYGLKKQQICENGDLVDDEALKQFWIGLDHIRSLHKDKSLQKLRPSSQLYGVKVLIAGEVPGTAYCLRSKKQSRQLEGPIEFTDSIDVYTSPERTASLRLCNWDFQDSMALDTYISSLIEKGDVERAASIHMFNLNLRKAIETLNTGATSSKKKQGDVLSAVAMAMAGYDSSRRTLWCEMCTLLCKQLNNPYLIAMFTFLTCTDGDYSTVLNESTCKMNIQDRVAFACIFLNDAKLSKYISALTDEVKSHGNLEGILLTGLTEDGVKLVSSYIDKTADVQTASLVAVLAFPSYLTTRDPTVQNWIDCYRNLLDTWRLWHQRARFDVFVQQESSKSKQDLQQIFVTCHFCQSPVSPSPYIPHVQASRIARMMDINRDARLRAKKTTCLTGKCRKPLPRCCLCLMNMGTNSLHKEKSEDLKIEKKQTDLTNWFTWCQSCRHGGHAHHMKKWFSSHVECPVTACACRCMLMDSVGSVSSVVTSS